MRGGILRAEELRAIADSIRVALLAKRVLREPILAGVDRLRRSDALRRSPTRSTGRSRKTAPMCATRPRRCCGSFAPSSGTGGRGCATSWRASRVRPTCAMRCRSPFSPSGAAGPCSRCARLPARRFRASCTTRRARGRRSSSSRSRSSSSTTALRRRRPTRAKRLSASCGELSAAVAARAADLVALVEETGALDLALARGGLSEAWGGAPVEVAAEVQAASPRATRSSIRRRAVPIDLDLGTLRALVISGPNTGGQDGRAEDASASPRCSTSPGCGRPLPPRACRSSTRCSRTSATASRSR